jgi:hypothetical protein
MNEIEFITAPVSPLGFIEGKAEDLMNGITSHIQRLISLCKEFIKSTNVFFFPSIIR